MKRKEVLVEAGKELDKVVSKEIFGVTIVVETCVDGRGHVYTPFPDKDLFPDYSTDMSMAWRVHREACGWLFSRRRLYLRFLQQAICDRLRTEADPPLEEGYVVDWPDVLCSLEPVDICLAALRVAGKDDHISELFDKVAEVAMRHDFSEDEIEEDIEQAVAEVRKKRRDDDDDSGT